MSFPSETKRKIVVLENGLISTYTVRDGLMKDLLRQNFEVYVLTHTNQFKDDVEAKGIRVLNVGSGNTNVFKIFIYFCKLFWYMHRIKPEVCLTFSVRPAIWGNLAARILNIPVITNISGIGPLFTSKNIAYKFIRSVYSIALQNTKRVFFQNEEDQEIFISHKFVKREQTALIPGSGIDYIKFSPVYNIQKSHHSFTFLFIGRLIKDKGIFEFIEAAKKVKEKYSESSFKVIGPLWQQNLKSNLVSEHQVGEWVAQGLIEYLGEKKDVRQDIATANCVVLPSYREGISNVLLESSSMETPCIASNVTGCKEVIEDKSTGLLCKPRDSQDLAHKMFQLMEMSSFELSEMGRKARLKVIREFDKQIVLNRYSLEINKVVTSSKRISLNGSNVIKRDFVPATTIAQSQAG